jgi:histidinol dehydrogenase
VKIFKWSSLTQSQQQDFIQRPAEVLIDRAKVTEVMMDVGSRGDSAIREWTRAFDGVQLGSFAVEKEKRTMALAQLDAELRQAMEQAAENIRRFHQAQQPRPHKVETLPGILCEQWPIPIENVGLYVPGGSAPLFSTVLMLAIPARLAGCKNVVVTTPPDRGGEVHPSVLAACELCEVDVVFSVGGIQAIAGLAKGTESIPQVNKIFGPGNAWVTEAKRQVSQIFPRVGVDLPAGPSEVLVVADGQADPEFIVWDLLSQAEHGPDSQVLLLSDSIDLLSKVSERLKEITPQLARAAAVESALKSSRLLLVADMDQAIEVSNNYAPEHLILNTQDARSLLPKVKNAGSVFVGAWSPESAGDYASGTNHVLPTSGAAAYSGGVSLASFYKFMTVQELSADGFMSLAPTIEAMAMAEGLQCHAQASVVRRQKRGRQ